MYNPNIKNFPVLLRYRTGFYSNIPALLILFAIAWILTIIGTLISSWSAVSAALTIIVSASLIWHALGLHYAYLAVSSEGITYHILTGITTFCAWKDIQESSKLIKNVVYPILIFTKREVVPPAVDDLKWAPREVTLRLFSEGPDSPLMQEIHKYRPDIKG